MTDAGVLAVAVLVVFATQVLMYALLLRRYREQSRRLVDAELQLRTCGWPITDVFDGYRGRCVRLDQQHGPADCWAHEPDPES